MPASFLLNMSLDPAAPLNRFEVKNKNITENNSIEVMPQVFEQTINYRFNGTNPLPSTSNSMESLQKNNKATFIVDT